MPDGRTDIGDDSKGSLNTACNLPETNEEFLFDTSRYYDQLVNLKDNNPAGVVFVAIVGVPLDSENIKKAPECQGAGTELSECLTHPSMKLTTNVFHTESGARYKHFAPACERFDDGRIVTSARPGRRYVKTAQSFGENGYVFSICNKDWSPAMNDVAQIIGRKISK